MEAGAETYGDASLNAPPAVLLNEIQEEVADIAGWGALLWHRLERLRPTLEQCGSEERR